MLAEYEADIIYGIISCGHKELKESVTCLPTVYNVGGGIH